LTAEEPGFGLSFLHVQSRPFNFLPSQMFHGIDSVFIRYTTGSLLPLFLFFFSLRVHGLGIWTKWIDWHWLTSCSPFLLCLLFKGLRLLDSDFICFYYRHSTESSAARYHFRYPFTHWMLPSGLYRETGVFGILFIALNPSWVAVLIFVYYLLSYIESLAFSDCILHWRSAWPSITIQYQYRSIGPSGYNTHLCR
jgi:hypothetical protein